MLLVGCCYYLVIVSCSYCISTVIKLLLNQKISWSFYNNRKKKVHYSEDFWFFFYFDVYCLLSAADLLWFLSIHFSVFAIQSLYVALMWYSILVCTGIIFSYIKHMVKGIVYSVVSWWLLLFQGRSAYFFFVLSFFCLVSLQLTHFFFPSPYTLFVLTLK